MSDARVALDVSPACGQPTGVGRYVCDLAHGLRAAGTPAIGVYQGHHGPPVAAITPALDGQHRYDWCGGRFGLRWRLPRVLRRCGATLYHATSTIGVPGPAWHGPVVATVHDCYPLRPEAQVAARHRRLFAALFAAVLRRVSVIICPTQHSADELVAYGWRGRTTVIHHGLPPLPPIPPRPATAGDDPYVLTIGAIEPRKAFDLLAVAIGAMTPQPRWFHLGPVRFDPDGAIQQAMRVAGGTLLGWRDDAERLAWLAHAACLVQPSRDEGFGYPPLEAMQLGVPVLATPAPALREVLGEAAWWLSAAHPEGWGEALRTLLDDTAQRAAWGERGRRHAAAFTIERMVQAHRTVYAAAW